MKIAVVILNYNGKAHLERYLPSVVEHSSLPDVEIVVADNGSTDDSVSFLQKRYPALRLIRFRRNYGFAGGYNQALAQVEADYYVLLNSDVEVTAGWLAPIIKTLDENPDIAAAQPKIRSVLAPEKFEHAGAAGGFIDHLGYPFCRGRVLLHLEEDSGQYDDVADIFWATGACLFIRSKDFREVGGFDARFFAHMEEIDLCWRLKSRGRRIVCVPQSVVYHLGGGTLRVESPQKTYLNFRNNLLMLYKNLPKKRLRKTLLIRLFFDYAASFQMLFTGKVRNARSIFKARHDFNRIRRKMKNDRKENLFKALISEPDGIYHGSIVLRYFAGKQTFKTIINR